MAIQRRASKKKKKLISRFSKKINVESSTTTKKQKQKNKNKACKIKAKRGVPVNAKIWNSLTVGARA